MTRRRRQEGERKEGSSFFAPGRKNKTRSVRRQRDIRLGSSSTNEPLETSICQPDSTRSFFSTLNYVKLTIKKHAFFRLAILLALVCELGIYFFPVCQ